MIICACHSDPSRQLHGERRESTNTHTCTTLFLCSQILLPTGSQTICIHCLLSGATHFLILAVLSHVAGWVSVHDKITALDRSWNCRWLLQREAFEAGEALRRQWTEFKHFIQPLKSFRAVFGASNAGQNPLFPFVLLSVAFLHVFPFHAPPLDSFPFSIILLFLSSSPSPQRTKKRSRGSCWFMIWTPFPCVLQ